MRLSYDTNSPVQLSIITATWQRPKFLAHLLATIQRQSGANLCIEHIVVSDGPDPITRALVQGAPCRYFELPEHQGNYGAASKDLGIQQARGAYICFWDDDNLYEPHAAATLYAAAQQAEIGVVQCRHWSVTRRKFVTLPHRWAGIFEPGRVDTLCVCIQRELALSQQWNALPHGRGTDHRWLTRLTETARTIRYVPLIIGTHLAFE